MSAIDPIKQVIAEELKIFDHRFKQSLKSDVFLLNLITRYVLKTKGKQIRPILVLLSAKMFGDIGEKTYTAASLVELLHTASLVHDDVVDEADERRGFFSIHRLWNSKTAVLFGDYLLARGLMISVDHQAFDLLRIVSVAVKEMSEGELLQLEHARKQDITQESYFAVIGKKTAALIAACVEAGAQSSDATPEQVEKMKQFGINLGLMFQIKDDVLDYQPTGITGKAPGNDLKEKKFTLPLIYALEQAAKNERKRMLQLINSSVSEVEKLKSVTNFILDKNGIEFCYTMMRELGQKAVDIIDAFPQNAATVALKGAVSYVAKRKN
jgi:octaprenyl-diphosphate synthase